MYHTSINVLVKCLSLPMSRLLCYQFYERLNQNEALQIFLKDKYLYLLLHMYVLYVRIQNS